MRRRFGSRRRIWGPATVYETTLASSSVLTGARSEPCRVCGDPIWLGDLCCARAWHVGFAHLACGWYTPADLSHEVRDAMHRCARNEGLSKEQWNVLVQGGWAKPTSHEVEWTERGERVFRQVQDIVLSVNLKEAS